MVTTWMPVVGYEGLYEVSDTGLVRSLHKKEKKIISIYTKNKYPTVCLSSADIKATKTVHRLVALSFIPNAYNKPYINHKDLNRFNNNVENLEWCTAQENSDHAKEAGVMTGARGEKNAGNRLKEGQAMHILNRRGDNYNAMNLETMQREGREGIKQQHNFEILFGAGSMAEQACESFLDQHTAATWKAALNSILESGLLEEFTEANHGGLPITYKEQGHNTLARDIKEFIIKMNSV